MIDATSLFGSAVFVLTPNRIGDERGFFSEVYNQASLAEIGITDTFVQDNHSLSAEQHVVRGLHFQIDPHPIAKLVRVTRGSVLDVVVDVRRGSPTYGQHAAVELSRENWKQIYVPVGFAHGFCTLEPNTEVAYKVTDHWSADVDKGLAWDDPDLGIDWPASAGDAILSDKDRNQPKLADLPEYFTWDGR